MYFAISAPTSATTACSLHRLSDRRAKSLPSNRARRSWRNCIRISRSIIRATYALFKRQWPVNGERCHFIQDRQATLDWEAPSLDREGKNNVTCPPFRCVKYSLKKSEAGSHSSKSTSRV